MQHKLSLPTEMWTGWCVVLCLLQLGGANAEVIQQPSLVLQEGHHAHLECNQTNKHDHMYWYQQKAKQGPDFLYYFIKNNEQQKGSISDRFSAYQPKEYRLDLNISSVKREDSAVYFCASSQERGNEKLYFGQGTRLTVLENGQEPTPPQVTIFAPSQKETEEKQAVTLVCLAKDFIPDHVSITWHLHDTEITEGVKTEEFSKYHNKTKSYSLTSRLRVSKLVWENSQNQFQCKVKFYVNDTTEIFESTISREGCDTAKVSYQSNGYIGSFVYVLLILKSIVYGAFVMGLFLRKKRVQ